MSFHEDDLKDGEASLVLGPTYFDARRVAERVMAKFEAEQFKPLIDKMASEFNDRLWNDVKSSLLEDTECNLQNEICRAVDACVEALLGGHMWALNKYILGSNYDHGKIREAVAIYIPQELQEKRIADLEEELRQAKEHIARLERRYL
jgi:hypothetical protein